MSTVKFAFPNVIFDIANVRYAKQHTPMSEQESLHDFARRIIAEKELSYRQVAERSRGHISTTTVSDIVNQKLKGITVDHLIGLAFGLGVSQNEIFAVARGVRRTEPTAAGAQAGFIVEEYANLSDENKAALMPVWEMIQREIRHRLAEQEREK